MFKRGSEYKRDEIAKLVRPDNPPRGGDWTTGYARIENDLFVFMNIGVAGRTGHDFENYYDEESNKIIWFSKPNKHSSNPLFQKLLSGELTPYFFARWNQNPPFTFLGTGSIKSYEDGYSSPQGHTCIRFVIAVDELDEIIAPHAPTTDTPSAAEHRSSFVFEKHLEDFLVKNWDKTPLASEYKIFNNDNRFGQQFRTDIGPIDILAERKDGSGFLVIELKRGRASDKVIGQILRYMGYVEKHLCTYNQTVSGCIIAQEKDQNLEYALRRVNDVEFLRYELNFRLTNES